MNSRREFAARRPGQIVLKGPLADAWVAEICRRCGISRGLYYRWRDQLLERTVRMSEQKGQGSAVVQELEAEDRRLKEVIAAVLHDVVEIPTGPSHVSGKRSSRTGPWTRSTP